MKWRLRRPVMLLFLAGIMVPSQMILLPLFTIYFQAGLTGSLWPLIITYTATGLPLTVFMMATYFRAVPGEIIEAAAIDGAGIFRIFFSVALPMMRNAILTVGTSAVLLHVERPAHRPDLHQQQQPADGASGPAELHRRSSAPIEYGPLFAAICITVGGTLILFTALNRQVMRGLAGGAVKG